MGSCLSLDQEELKARARSDDIDKQLQTWAKEEESCIKILLLGEWIMPENDYYRTTNKDMFNKRNNFS